MIDIQIYKLIDAGHFWCKPFSKDRRKIEQYYTLTGKINDYCARRETTSQTGIPNKGQVCLARRTSDKCWHRARVLSVFQTINGPQARVLLVDLGERTLVPGIWIREIPEEFLDTPFQTMECVLSGLKPITLTTSYFDLTVTKQPGDRWDVAATEWLKKHISGASLQIDVKYIDEDGVHHVILFTNTPKAMICLNDELVNEQYAIPFRSFAMQDESAAPKKENQNPNAFSEERSEIMEQLNSFLNAESDSSDSNKPRTTRQSNVHHTKGRYQPLDTDTELFSCDESRQNNTAVLTSRPTGAKVRFLAARLPATGTKTKSPEKQIHPILKTSSGYSSSEREDVPWSADRDSKSPTRAGHRTPVNANSPYYTTTYGPQSTDRHGVHPSNIPCGDGPIQNTTTIKSPHDIAKQGPTPPESILPSDRYLPLPQHGQTSKIPFDTRESPCNQNSPPLLSPAYDSRPQYGQPNIIPYSGAQTSPFNDRSPQQSTTMYTGLPHGQPNNIPYNGTQKSPCESLLQSIVHTSSPQHGQPNNAPYSGVQKPPYSESPQQSATMYTGLSQDGQTSNISSISSQKSPCRETPQHATTVHTDSLQHGQSSNIPHDGRSPYNTMSPSGNSRQDDRSRAPQRTTMYTSFPQHGQSSARYLQTVDDQNRGAAKSPHSTTESFYGGDMRTRDAVPKSPYDNIAPHMTTDSFTHPPSTMVPDIHRQVPNNARPLKNMVSRSEDMPSTDSKQALSQMMTSKAALLSSMPPPRRPLSSTQSSCAPYVTQPSPVTPPRPAPTPSPAKSLLVPTPALCHVTHDIFAFGEGPPKPIHDIDSSTFPDVLLRALQDICITKPTAFQSHVWSAILRGRDVCCVPNLGNSGILSYILPLVTQITEPQVYSELPLGNGPLAVVLCSEWRKVETIYDICHKLTKKQRNIRVQVLYGAGHEDEHILNLINGCEIIIATAPCFLRMLSKGYTRLDRLCHLVFDDADVLAEERTQCVKEIMRTYGGFLTSNKERLAPRQCITVTHKWTPGVASLVKAYLGNPLVIMANPMESAAFCNVNQTAKFISATQRDKYLIGSLDTLTNDVQHEIIVFTTAAKDAEHVADVLQHDSYAVLLAHEFMRPEYLKEIHRQWNTPETTQSCSVIVMTDGVIDMCQVRNASCVIHYDFPSSKTLFGKRLFCMSASYPSTEDKPCLSMIFSTHITTAKFLQSIKDIVVRSGGELPADLEPFIKMANEAKEEKRKANDLCYALKAFGICKKVSKCKNRHVVFPDVDVSELLPRSGIVKALVLKVWDASHFYVRILEHKANSKEKAPISNYYSGAAFLKLALDLNTWYGLPGNRQLCGVIKCHKFCVAYSEGAYYRVRIVRVVREEPETKQAIEVEVFFVDRGFYDDLSTRNLLEIAPQFIDAPYQAVEVFVGRVKPIDDDAWTYKSDRFVKQNIEGREIEGRVVMGLRNTIWLDPAVVRTHLADINVTTNTFNVRLDLLKESLGVPNPEHFDKLKKHFESYVTMTELTGEDGSLNCSPLIETATLPDKDFTLVKVPSVVNPGLFYVRLEEYSDRLADTVDMITDEMDNPTAHQSNDLAIGSLCVAKFSSDNEWYRGKIFSIRPENDEYEVFFLDYGDREWVSQDNIVSAWPEILELPFQAIECSLANISPLENEWTKEASDALWDLTGEKLFYIKVKSKSTAQFAGTCSYVVELYDTSTGSDVLLNHELVATGHAQATLEFHKTLFPDAFQADRHKKEHYEEIPELCLQIYRTQDADMKLQLTKEVKNILTDYNDIEEGALRKCGAIRSICRLLGVSKCEAVKELIVISLAILVTKDEQSADEIRREGGLKSLCQLLATSTNNSQLLEHASWAIKSLSTNDRNRDEIRELGGIKNLCALLETVNNEKVQENSCWAFVALCADNNKNCDAMREAGGIEKLFNLLKSSRDDSVLENVLWAISILATNTKNKRLIGEQGYIEIICNLIENNKSEKVFTNCIRCLKTLSSYNDENRAIMCDLGIINVMRRLTEFTDTLPFDVRRLCLDLIQRLLGRSPDVPLVEASSVMSGLHEPVTRKPIYVTKKKDRPKQQNGVNGLTKYADDSEDDLPPLESSADHFLPVAHPQTMWSQTKNFVTLSIKLRGVEEKTSQLTERKLYFKTKHLGKMYELSLDFFAPINPKESKTYIRGSEVLITLKKTQPGAWKRLLSSVVKPPYLSIDFDRWDSRSSNDDDDDTPRPRYRPSMTKASKTNKLDFILPRESDSDSVTSEEEVDTGNQFFDFS